MNAPNSISAQRLPRFRAVMLLLVAFMTYFILAKPAMAASAKVGVLKIPAAESQAQVLNDFESSDASQSDPVDGETPSSDFAGLDFEIDDFLISPISFTSLASSISYETLDAHLPRPAFERGVDYPPKQAV